MRFGRATGQAGANEHRQKQMTKCLKHFHTTVLSVVQYVQLDY
jgi:hypothetical protein